MSIVWRLLSFLAFRLPLLIALGVLCKIGTLMVIPFVFVPCVWKQLAVFWGWFSSPCLHSVPVPFVSAHCCVRSLAQLELFACTLFSLRESLLRQYTICLKPRFVEHALVFSVSRAPNGAKAMVDVSFHWQAGNVHWAVGLSPLTSLWSEPRRFRCLHLFWFSYSEKVIKKRLAEYVGRDAACWHGS